MCTIIFLCIQMMPMQTFYICCRCLRLSFVLNTFAVPLSEITMRLRVPFYNIVNSIHQIRFWHWHCPVMGVGLAYWSKQNRLIFNICKGWAGLVRELLAVDWLLALSSSQAAVSSTPGCLPYTAPPPPSPSPPVCLPTTHFHANQYVRRKSWVSLLCKIVCMKEV